MRVACIGGGPAGLYFSILLKKARPEAEITVYERNKPADTFGWGVVFSDETLGGFEQADAESYAEIRRQFAYWTDIETHLEVAPGRMQCVRSTGHGFCGLSRKALLQIFHARARALGVRLEFETEVRDESDVGRADLILACDGLNSFVRTKHAAHFRPTLEWRKCKFAWFGTTKPLAAFTFVFRSSEHGLFQVHAYPFQRGASAAEPTLSTWIVECHEDVWKRAGFEHASEQETVRYLEDLFAPDLDGHRLLTNKSVWRSFPVIRCGTWVRGNTVLAGDAAHTAHFSIGSGTKLAMEDSIELVAALRDSPSGDVPKALALYEQRRGPEVARVQRAARTSMEWFENSARYVKQRPLSFAFNLMTRSRRITYDNLRQRDPELVRRVTQDFAEQNGLACATRDVAPPPLFAPLTLRSLCLANRIVVSPMCQYSAVDGAVGDWHLVHLGSRAVGGAGLVLAEMTDVSAAGRITLGCAGMYADEHERAWTRIVDFVHTHSRAKIGLQLAHAGRKGSCNLPWEGDDPLRDARAWPTLAPSARAFAPGWPVPRAMARAEMERVRDEFVAATRRAARAGFDLLELHFAHGYLLSSFLSPASNQRTDEYGGALANRQRFPLEVFEAVRAAWPAEKPLAVRVSATDWLPTGEGTTLEETVEFARTLHARGLDLIDVSSAGNTPDSPVEYGRMYQVPFAERIRYEVPGLAVMAVGGIQGADHANTILAAGRADLCALARAHLTHPYLTLDASASYGVPEFPWPKQYLPARPRPRD
ncbi:MAG: bifunctional salicylyl-CoA 5-hydroxylase/oxidoreductase [Planctomycetes bacterium]|nr:bifunctional salicylyl-CoA 5-hydroxylase/oxidoreductase [Planctomycetota bacterium]